jgi:hypothetical protein
VLTTADILGIQLYTAGSNISISPSGVISVVSSPTFTGIVTSIGGFDASNQRIVNVANPVAPTDAVNKQYVDTILDSFGVESITFTLPSVPMVVCSNAPTKVYEWVVPDAAAYRVYLSVRYSATGNAIVSLKQGGATLGTTRMRCGPDEQMILSTVIPLMTTTVANSTVELWVSGPSSVVQWHYQVTLERVHIELQPILSSQPLQTFSVPSSVTLSGKSGTEVSIGSFTLSAATAGNYRLAMSMEYSDTGSCQFLIRVNSSLLQSVKEHLSPSDVNTVSIYEDVTMNVPGSVTVDVSVVFGLSYKSVSILDLFGELQFIG